MKKIIEIRSAEGGNDSKLFVKDMVDIYESLAKKMNWNFKIENVNKDNFGYNIAILSFKSKKEDLDLLNQEVGGHRYQRVPPTERNGRVHTSTITIAVLDEFFLSDNIELNEKDLKVEWYSGTGKGGQHRNKHQNSCRVTHIPTGIVESRQGRERSKNLESAKKSIIEKLKIKDKNKIKNENNDKRKIQIGSGMRADKVRTIRFQDNNVTNHENKKTITLKEYLNGDIFKIWNNI